MNIVDTTSKQQLRYRVPFPEGDVWGNSLKGQVRIEFGLKLVEVERGEIWVNEHRNVLESIFEETPLVTNSFHRIAGAIGRFGFEREALGMLAALTPQRRSRIEQVMLEAEPGTPLALTDEQKRVISRFSQAVGGKSKALLPAYYEFDQLQELAELLETYPVSTAKQLYLHLREGSIIGDARECLSKWEEVRPMLEVILEEEDERFLGLLERYRKNGLIEKMMSLPRYPGQNRTDLWYAVHPELVEHHYGELCEYLEQHPVFGVMVLSAVGEHTLNLEKQCGDLVTRIIQIYGEDDREDEVRLALKALKPEIWHLRPELDRLLEQTRVGFHSVLENDLAAILQPSSVTTYHLAINNSFELYKKVSAALEGTPVGEDHRLIQEYCRLSKWDEECAATAIAATPCTQDPELFKPMLESYGLATYAVLSAIGSDTDLIPKLHDTICYMIGKMDPYCAARFFLAVPCRSWSTYGVEMAERYEEGAYGMHQLREDATDCDFRQLEGLVPTLREDLGIYSPARYVRVDNYGTVTLNVVSKMLSTWRGEELRGDNATLGLVARGDWNEVTQNKGHFKVLRALGDNTDFLLTEFGTKEEFLERAGAIHAHFQDIDPSFRGFRLFFLSAHAGIRRMTLNDGNAHLAQAAQHFEPSDPLNAEYIEGLRSLAHPEGSHIIMCSCSAGAGGEHNPDNHAMVFKGGDERIGVSAPRRPAYIKDVKFDQEGRFLRAVFSLDDWDVLRVKSGSLSKL